MKSILFFTMLTISIACSANGQDVFPKFNSITINDGLSESSVTSILQDHQGYMWFATQDGINKYDGHRFIYYKSDPFNANSLSDNHVRVMLQDKQGIFWIGTKGGGLNRFDPLTERFIRYNHDPKNNHSISDDILTVIHEDKHGMLWIGTENGLCKFDKSTQSFTIYKNDPNDKNSLSHHHILAISEDDQGMLWIGTDEGGLNRFNPTTNQFKSYTQEAYPGIADNSITVIYPRKADELWLGTNKSGLIRFNPNTNEFSRFYMEEHDVKTLNSNTIQAIFEDSYGRFWVGTDKGLHLFNPEKKEFRRFLHDPSDPFSLTHNDIFSIYEDNAGNVWFGTYLGGVNKYSPKKFQYHLKHDPQNPTSMKDSNIWSIYEDHNRLLWLGTQQAGVYIYDRQTNTLVNYHHDSENPNSLSNNRVQAFCEDGQNRMWIGTEDGLNRFDPKTNAFQVFKNDPANLKTISSNDVMWIRYDPKGYLWIGTYAGGVNIFDLATETFTCLKHDPNNKNSLSHNKVRTLFLDKQGLLWVGVENGLNFFDPQKQQWGLYQHDVYQPTSILNNRVFCIYEDRHERLWIGTGNGLDQLDRNTHEFKHVTEKEGLPNNTIYGILEDTEGNLWLSTNKGISKYTPSSGQIQNYDVQDGLQSNEFNMGAYHQSSKGEMFFGGINGLTYFYPQHIKNNPHIPPVYITGFGIFDRMQRIEKSLDNQGRIVLSYKDNYISFEFVALDYVNPNQNQYAYQLEGFDQEWLYCENRRYASYTNLDGGTYWFNVKGSNNDGLWNETGMRIQINVYPPPWKTWWAYTLYVLGLICGVVLFIRFKTAAQQKKIDTQKKELDQERQVSERLKKIDKMKDEFLANTSHELRTPLNGIIGLVDSILDGVSGPLNNTMRKNLYMVNLSATRLNTLVNDILDFSKLKHKHIELQTKPIDIKTIIDIVMLLTQPLIGKKELILSNKIDQVTSIMGDENRIQQIFINVIGNAIKFTERGTVEMSAQYNGDYVEVYVKDSGIGIPADKFNAIFESFEQADGDTERTYGGTGLGLSISKQLIELHHGYIRVESVLGQGSTFIIGLPASKDNLTAIPLQINPEHIRHVIDTEESGIDAHEIVPKDSGEHEQKTFKILIVDDEPINLQVLMNYLQLHKYAVTQALNAFEAIDCMDQGYVPDLAIIDIMMPKMSGYELTQKIRERFSKNTLPIILLTAKNQINDLIVGFESGANDYLIKPFSKKELMARLQSHIYSSKLSIAYERFVPKEFLNYLDKETILEVELGNQVLKEMTVLFSDIRSFTTLSEKMTAQENFDFINSYLRRMEPIINDHQGFIDKYIGDAIMALFPLEPEHAINAGIAMQQEVFQYNIRRIQKGYDPIEIGIGIHTGKLMLGTVGGKNRMDGTVISDNVNLASRLEGLNKYYGTNIIISNSTLDKIQKKENYAYRLIDTVRVKGKSDAVALIEILDGLIEKQRDLKMNTLSDFSKAMACYQRKEFSKAYDLFSSMLNSNAHDQIVHLYLNRCKKYIHEGIPDHWDGIEKLYEK
ncbi:MAG: response regulator [Desulfobacterales bacterium]|nr:response regulator [Desulfobacterales bacterium]